MTITGNSSVVKARGMRAMPSLLLVSIIISSVQCASNDTANNQSPSPLQESSVAEPPDQSLPVISRDSLHGRNFIFQGVKWAFLKPHCSSNGAGACDNADSLELLEKERADEYKLAKDSDKALGSNSDVEGSESKSRPMKRWKVKRTDAPKEPQPTPTADPQAQVQEDPVPPRESGPADPQDPQEEPIVAEEQHQRRSWQGLEVPSQELRDMYLQSPPQSRSSFLSLYEAGPIRPRSSADDPSRRTIDFSRLAFFWIFHNRLPRDMPWDFNVEARIRSQYLGLHVHYLISPALLYAMFEASVWRTDALYRISSASIPERWEKNVMKAGLLERIRGVLNKPENLFDATPRIAALREVMLFRVSSWVLAHGGIHMSMPMRNDGSFPVPDEGLFFASPRLDPEDILEEDVAHPVRHFARHFPWATTMTRREANAVRKLMTAQKEPYEAILYELHTLFWDKDNRDSDYTGPGRYPITEMLRLSHGFRVQQCAVQSLNLALNEEFATFMPDRDRRRRRPGRRPRPAAPTAEDDRCVRRRTGDRCR